MCYSRYGSRTTPGKTSTASSVATAVCGITQWQRDKRLQKQSRVKTVRRDGGFTRSRRLARVEGRMLRVAFFYFISTSLLHCPALHQSVLPLAFRILSLHAAAGKKTAQMNERKQWQSSTTHHRSPAHMLWLSVCSACRSANINCNLFAI